MKIAFIGAGAVGKSTLIEKFIERWPMYKKPEVTYRDIIKSKKLKLNKDGTAKSQKAILNALVDEAQQAAASDNEFVVFDRCVVDNIAYTLWHFAKGTEGFTKEFVIDCQTIATLALKHYDVIFYLPARQEIPLTEKENREIDEVFREEIDNIFKALVLSYEKRTGAFFPVEDCPAVIVLEGPADMRLPQISLYIKENGKTFSEEDGSLISTAEI